ncbi:uncharacterized protein LOC141726727 isoform X8 [Zonotrichia albicollis]|uniref:uncharacterized protein LOC141726727 isoform X8 n=1 Tax=Zonotrichia albicollis TaxID=44394 RepID=UPI003D8116CD
MPTWTHLGAAQCPPGGALCPPGEHTGAQCPPGHGRGAQCSPEDQAGDLCPPGHTLEVPSAHLEVPNVHLDRAEVPSAHLESMDMLSAHLDTPWRCPVLTWNPPRKCPVLTWTDLGDTQCPPGDHTGAQCSPGHTLEIPSAHLESTQVPSAHLDTPWRCPVPTWRAHRCPVPTWTHLGGAQCPPGEHTGAQCSPGHTLEVPDAHLESTQVPSAHLDTPWRCPVPTWNPAGAPGLGDPMPCPCAHLCPQVHTGLYWFVLVQAMDTPSDEGDDDDDEQAQERPLQITGVPSEAVDDDEGDDDDDDEQDQECPLQIMDVPVEAADDEGDDDDDEESVAEAQERLLQALMARADRALPRRALERDWAVLGELGSGSYGRVLLARPRHGGAQVALKLLSKARTPRLRFLREFCTHLCLRGALTCVQVLPLAFETPTEFGFAQELAPAGDLCGLLTPGVSHRWVSRSRR